MAAVRTAAGISRAVCPAAWGGCRRCPTSDGHGEGTRAGQVPVALSLCPSVATSSHGDTVGGAEARTVAGAVTLAVVAAVWKVQSHYGQSWQRGTVSKRCTREGLQEPLVAG